MELTELPVQHNFVPTKFNSAETAIIQQEINKMIKKGIIEKVSHEKHEIISNIFSIPKKDGTHRVILNLKEFNRNVSYHHFKMDSLNTILKLLDKDCFMASLDLKDAYYSIPIRKSDLDFVPVIDLFASRINKQVEQYVSYRPDSHAAAVDAFTLTWTKLTFYAFPPFSLIPNVLSKIKNEKARGVCVLPKWPTQPWYAKAMEMLEKPPIHLKASNYLLRLPSHPEETHPLFKKLHLMVCLLSGKV